MKQLNREISKLKENNFHLGEHAEVNVTGSFVCMFYIQRET